MSKHSCIANIRAGDGVIFTENDSNEPVVGFIVGVLNLTTAWAKEPNHWFLAMLKNKSPESSSDIEIIAQVKSSYEEYIEKWFLPNWDEFGNFKFLSHNNSVQSFSEKTFFQRILKPKVFWDIMDPAMVELVKGTGRA